jgi:hypothetical protein
VKITIEFEGIDDGNEEIVADKLKEDRFWAILGRLQDTVPIGAGYVEREIKPNSVTLIGVDTSDWDSIGELAEELKDIEDYYKSPQAQQNAIKDLQNTEKQAQGEYELSLEEPY